MTIEEELKSNNEPGIRGLWKIYNSKNRLFRSKFFQFSIVLSILITCAGIIFDVKSTILLNKLISNIETILPNILGFNIGAYVLLIAFIANKETKELSEKNNNRFTLIQHQSSVFAFSIFVQSFTLCLSFVISIIYSLQLPPIPDCINSNNINYFIIFILMFCSLYSISLIIRVVLNVFDLGQSIHFFVSVNEIEKKNKEASKRKKTTGDKKN